MSGRQKKLTKEGLTWVADEANRFALLAYDGVKRAPYTVLKDWSGEYRAILGFGDSAKVLGSWKSQGQAAAACQSHAERVGTREATRAGGKVSEPAVDVPTCVEEELGQ